MIEKVIVVALVALVLPAEGVARDLVLSLQGGALFDYDGSYDVLSRDDQFGYVHYGVGLGIYENLRVHAEYEFGGESDPLFRDLDLDFKLHAALITAEYGYPLLPFLRPHVRVGVGAYWGDVDLFSGGIEYDAKAWGLGFHALAGFDLIWQIGDPKRADRDFWDRLSIALTNDYGWAHRPTLDFDSMTADAPGGRVVDVDLGEVALRGWTWRLGLTFGYEL